MEKFTLQVESRENAGKGVARSLRRQGKTPGVLYRAGKAASIQLTAKELAQFINKTAGEMVLVHLNFAEDTKQAIVKDFQLDPITSQVLHVDFQEIAADEELRINVHVNTAGEPIGVKRDGGMLQHGLRDIEISCLPDKIIGHVTVDVSKMLVGQSIHVSDLNLGEGIKVLTDDHELIAAVIAVKETVVAAEPVVAAVAEPEVVKKGKKTEESGK
ncbi:MAG: large subunit ribosomal protein L25 [Nitrospirae bacterium]|nr:MAG: large subunit ribosomal protein L25 [Nitrospirota bacterium]